MRKYVLVIMMLAGSLATISAQSVLSFPVGEYWHFPDARTLGMAGGGSVSNHSASALMMNPAAMASSEAGLGIQLTASARNMEERRSFPIFNRIDDITQQGIYVINDHWYTGMQGGAQFSFESNSRPYSIAVGVFSELDQDFSYEEEVRENIFGDEQIAYNEIRFNGDLTRVSVGAALEILEGLNFGVQAGMLSGDLEASRSVEFVAGSEDNILETTGRALDNTPLVASLGATYNINSRVTFGSYLRLPYTTEYQVSHEDSIAASTYAESIEYPLQLNVALEYRGQQELQARINIDFSYEWWSNADLATEQLIQTAPFEDAVTVKTSIEHIFFNQVPFQVGLQYRTAYQDRSSSRTLITAGTGLLGDNWQVDLAGGFSKLTYTAPDLFDDTLFGGDRSQSIFDDVEERYFFGMVTLRAYLR